MNESDYVAPSGVGQLNVDDFAAFAPSVSDISEHRIVGFDNKDRRSRAFSNLRTVLSKEMEEKNCRLLGIASASPDAGKSFLSMNLAASLSRVVTNLVVVVDLDLRKASLAKQIGLECDGGVEKLLSGEISDIRSVGRRIEDTNLVVLPTGRISGSSAECVAGPNFDSFIKELRERLPGSTIIFDLPPAFAGDDAMLIMQKLDGYVMVVDSGRTRKQQLTEVLHRFQPKPCLGVIINRYQGGIMDLYGYGYGSYDYSAYYD